MLLSKDRVWLIVFRAGKKKEFMVVLQISHVQAFQIALVMKYLSRLADIQSSGNI